MVESLLYVLILGVAAFALTIQIRALVVDWFPKLAVKKPFACDACMSFWSTLAVFAMSKWLDHEQPMGTEVCAAIGVAYLSIKGAALLNPPPPEL